MSKAKGMRSGFLEVEPRRTNPATQIAPQSVQPSKADPLQTIVQCPAAILPATGGIKFSTCQVTKRPIIPKYSAIHELCAFGGIVSIGAITWFTWTGVVDAGNGTELTADELSRSLQWRHSVKCRTCSAKAHWQDAIRTEEHGRIIQLLLAKTDIEHHPNNQTMNVMYNWFPESSPTEPLPGTPATPSPVEVPVSDSSNDEDDEDEDEDDEDEDEDEEDEDEEENEDDDDEDDHFVDFCGVKLTWLSSK